MAKQPDSSKPASTLTVSGNWDGVERRRDQDRRDLDRRLDERREAGIGEIMDDRRGQRTRTGRRREDRRNVLTRRATDTT